MKTKAKAFLITLLWMSLFFAMIGSLVVYPDETLFLLLLSILIIIFIAVYTILLDVLDAW